MAPTSGGRNAKKAAIYMWILSGVLIVFFGCCSSLFGLLTLIPFDELLGHPEMKQLDPVLFEQIYKMSSAIALTLMAIGLVPAILFCILAFFVRQTNKPAMITTAVLMILVAVVMGFMLLSTLAEALKQGNFPALFIGLLMFGLPVGLSVAVLYYLNLAKNESVDGDQQDWNTPQPWE